MDCPSFLRIATLQPFIKLADKGAMLGSRGDAELAKIFSQKLSFSYETVSPRNLDWGSYLGNGSWSGLVDMLQRNEVDMIISTLSITEDRSHVIDFSFPYQIDRLLFITRKLEKLNDQQSFLKPFTTAVWIYIFLICFILPALYTILFKRKQTTKQFGKATKSSLRIPVNAPDGVGHICLRVCWLIFQNLLRWSYAAVLLSFLTLPRLTGVRTIKELATAVQKGEYFCTSYGGSYFADVMENSYDPYVKVIGQSLKNNEKNVDLSALFQNSDSPMKPAYISEESRLIGLDTEYFVSDNSIFPDYIAVGIRKGLCFKQKLDYVIHAIWSSGIHIKLTSDFTTLYNYDILWNSPDSAENDSRRCLSLADYQGVFILLVLGHTIATVTFLFELILGTWKIKISQ